VREHSGETEIDIFLKERERDRESFGEVVFPNERTAYHTHIYY
jgi:hypothetical protein